jgi:NAD(P)-dependent dehydrogenase (short-subunit alcohol dehydrogenase family)
MRGEYARSVVITGAASGFGRAMSVAWAEKGWRIGIADIDMEGAGETLEMVERAGGSGEVFNCNVRELEVVQAMADHFFESWGEVGVVVNNAGVVDVGCMGDIQIEDWERIIEINLMGVIYGCHAFIPRMKEHGGGHVVNTASLAGIASLPEMAPYNVVKAGTISLSETLRTELAPYGIGVTVICPSFFKTNLLSDMTCTDEWERDFAQATFAGARMTADEIAEMVVRAVERNRFYLLPQSSAKSTWLMKRMFPETLYRVLGVLLNSERGRNIFMWMARHGILG